MRFSRLITQTLREAPAGVELPGQQFLLRAGYAHPLSAGVLAPLPLGELALTRLEAAMRERLLLEDAQRISLPLVEPASLVPGAASFQDAGGRQISLTSSRVLPLAQVLQAHIRSHRQLPAALAISGPAWNDAPRPRGGWLQARYDRMVSGCWLLPEDGQLEKQSEDLTIFFESLDLPAAWVQDDPGLFGDRGTALFHFLEAGDEQSLICEGCGYSAMIEVAGFARQTSEEAVLPLEKVATPHCPTIDSLAQFLKIPASRTAKAVFLTAELPGREQLVFAVVRGDRDLSEIKLARLIGARSLRPASDAEIQAVRAVPGYASPVGLEDAWVIVDEEIPLSPNLVSGANEEGYHLRNVNYGRDYTARQAADIALARPGDACPQCGQGLKLQPGVRLVRQAIYPALPECEYRDEAGQLRPLPAAITTVPLYRLLASLAERHHDERGLKLPRLAAPFDVHLVLLGSKTGQPEAEAAALYDRLRAAGWAVLLDDRADSPGVKFNDADLIGVPLRLTVSERSLKNGGVEVKARAGGEAHIVEMSKILGFISQFYG